MSTISADKPRSVVQLDQAKRHLADLVSFDTVSRNSNLPLIEHMADFFGRLGADITILPDVSGKKANLIARFGPQDRPGIVLSGHTDVVPADEAEWESDPFTLCEREGRLFGRGTCDMKGFAACVMAIAPQMARAPLDRPVYLCFSYDEEVGCLGAPAIANHLAALPFPPHFAVIGEPSNMKLVTGQKGKVAMRAHVRGISGHSSLAPKHVNAIENAAIAMNLIACRAKRYEIDGPFDHEFTVPHATMLTTMISGGVATNVTPDNCSFTFELRSIPGMDADDDIEAVIAEIDERIAAPMRAGDPHAGVRWERIFAYPAMGDATATSGFAKYADLMPEYGGKVSYGSEGGIFETIGGIPSVIVGPGSILQAHKPNEFIEIEQLEQCLEYLSCLIERLEQVESSN